MNVRMETPPTHTRPRSLAHADACMHMHARKEKRGSWALGPRPPPPPPQDFSSNGIFTSDTTDPDWASAHGLLPRFFNALKIKGFFPASEPSRARVQH